MLHEFVTRQRQQIIDRTREMLTNRPWPMASTSELDHGVPLFLTQLSETLRLETTATPFPSATIAAAAARHGGELRALGFNVSQVVHGYGDICQAITELAGEQQAPITAEEFHTLNRCLDTAIAEAVTEHARITARSKSAEDLERGGQLAHELRNMLHTALFAYDALKRGTVAINGSTGALLGRSLMGLRDLVDSTLSDVRIAAHQDLRERIPIGAFLNDIAVAARLHADDRGLQFVIDPVDLEWAIDGDPQLLSSAVMNVLNNAFKYTPRGGHVALRTRRSHDHVLIEVHDECGGLPEDQRTMFQSFGDRRGTDRTGLGLGLSIARKAVKAQGGDIHIFNRPGRGCVVTIEVPLATANGSVSTELLEPSSNR